MNKTLLSVSLSLSLLVPLCAQAGAKEDFEKTYSEAVSTNENAGNFQWTTTFSTLKAAKSAAESGDYEEANAMASKALKLAEESMVQRKEQATAWKSAVIGG